MWINVCARRLDSRKGDHLVMAQFSPLSCSFHFPLVKRTNFYVFTCPVTWECPEVIRRSSACPWSCLYVSVELHFSFIRESDWQYSCFSAGWFHRQWGRSTTHNHKHASGFTRLISVRHDHTSFTIISCRKYFVLVENPETGQESWTLFMTYFSRTGGLTPLIPLELLQNLHYCWFVEPMSGRWILVIFLCISM